MAVFVAIVVIAVVLGLSSVPTSSLDIVLVFCKLLDIMKDAKKSDCQDSVTLC